MNNRKHPESIFGALSTDNDGEQVRLRRPEPHKDENLKRLSVDHDCDISICDHREKTKKIKVIFTHIYIGLGIYPYHSKI